MAAFDNTLQQQIARSKARLETGGGVTIAGNDDIYDQTFTIATKLKKVLCGMAYMETDGMVAVATVGIVDAGQVTFTRKGPIVTNADTATYWLIGY